VFVVYLIALLYSGQVSFTLTNRKGEKTQWKRINGTWTRIR
jgi:cytochrome oxidase Cu insertion factor (SCO1/SenC/PrrC family)